MSLSDFGKSLKKGLATAMGVPEIKQKVLTATSNDPWGPTGQQMREIADATHHYAEFGLIMESIWERLNEPGKYWRHVYKALLLLDYLLKNGADQCVREARVKMIEIKTLTEFQHIDDKDKDQGLSVRERAKAIVELLHDERRLNEERSKARANRDKFSNAISSDQARYGGSYGGGGGGGGGGGRSYQSKRPTGPPSYVDEQDFEPPSRTSPGVGSTYGGGRSHHASRNNDLDFSSGDDMDDEFPDYQSPATTPAARQPARQPEPPRPAPAPAPLIDLLGGEPARPAPVSDPNAGFFGATPAVGAPAGFGGFPAATPAAQFVGGFAAAPAHAASGFPGGFAAAPTASGFGGFPAAAPATVPGGFPTGPGPAAGGFTMPTAATAPAVAPTTPAFFQPTPGSSEADWSEFQSGRAPEPVKPAEPALDPSDPWARNDLFSFSKDKPSAASASTVKKTPMGAAGVKPTMGAVPTPVVPGNPNMFGMTAAAPPTVMTGYPATMAGHPGFVGQPGFGMVAAPAPGGFGMTAAVPAGYGVAAPIPGGFGMTSPGGFGMIPGMPMAGGMPMMGAHPGYGQR